MAEKSCCTVCGKELGFLTSSYVRCGETNQMVCSDCEKLIQGADGPQMLSILEMMLKSEYLADREQFEAYLEYMKQQVAEMSQKYKCCGRPMQFCGVQEFQQGSTDFFTGNLGNMLAGSMEMAIFRCTVCGQYKFYDPQYVSLLSGENKTCPQCGKKFPGHLCQCPDCGKGDEPERTIQCPECGHTHTFYDLVCPECGYRYTGDELHKPSNKDAKRERELERQVREQEKKEKSGWFGRKKTDKPRWEL